jgi:cobyrinic acid a,c-diamide synthase
LGLIAPEGDGAFETLAAAVERHIPLDRVLALATPLATESSTSEPTRASALRLAVAEDQAFSFIYADLRQSLEARGVNWLSCSPLRDTTIPEDAEALYLPGGYPEEHAAELAQNRPFLDSLRRFAHRRPVYAECGGLMLLCQSLVDRDAKTHELAGIVPGRTRMGRTLTRLGYAEVTLVEDSLWGKVGDQCRGHEFRYSDLELDDAIGDDWRRAYLVQYRGGLCASEGFQRGRVLASYVHLHLASRPRLLDRFLERLSQP